MSALKFHPRSYFSGTKLYRRKEKKIINANFIREISQSTYDYKLRKLAGFFPRNFFILLQEISDLEKKNFPGFPWNCFPGMKPYFLGPMEAGPECSTHGIATSYKETRSVCLSVRPSVCLPRSLDRFGGDLAFMDEGRLGMGERSPLANNGWSPIYLVKVME